MSSRKMVRVGIHVVSKIDVEPDTERCRKQARRLARLGRMGIAVPQLLDQGEHAGRTWAIWERVHGPTLRDLPALDEAQRYALRTLKRILVDARVHVGDLHARNVIWDGGRWVVIDCGAIRGRSTCDILAALDTRLEEGKRR